MVTSSEKTPTICSLTIRISSRQVSIPRMLATSLHRQYSLVNQCNRTSICRTTTTDTTIIWAEGRIIWELLIYRTTKEKWCGPASRRLIIKKCKRRKKANFCNKNLIIIYWEIIIITIRMTQGTLITPIMRAVSMCHLDRMAEHIRFSTYQPTSFRCTSMQLAATTCKIALVLLDQAWAITSRRWMNIERVCRECRIQILTKIIIHLQLVLPFFSLNH